MLTGQHMFEHRLIVSLVSLVVACNSGSRPSADTTAATATAPPVASSGNRAETPAFTAESMRGIWYECPAVGGGYCSRLVLAAGRYEWRASQSSCERIVLRRGQWRVEGATLILEEASHVEIDGGTCTTSDTGPRWSNATVHDRTVEARSMERLALSACSESERSQSEASCVRMREAPRWKLATPESMDPEPMPRLAP